MYANLVISGKPYEVNKVYSILKKEFSDLDYFSEEYVKMVCVPRGTSEIEILDKKGYIIFYFKKDLLINSYLKTKFTRKEGKTVGLISKLILNFDSKDLSLSSKVLEKIEKLNYSFDSKRKLILDFSLDSL